MAVHAEVLAFGCLEKDLATLTTVFGRTGPAVRATRTQSDFARQAVSSRPLAVVLGVGTTSIAHLEVISLIHTVRTEIPVVVIAHDDSLELERAARQQEIFYYLVHPVQEAEVRAVLNDLLRYANT